MHGAKSGRTYNGYSMIFLYILNLIIWIALIIFPPLYFTLYFKLKPINPLTVYAFLKAPSTIITTISGPIVFLKNGLFNPYFHYALLVHDTRIMLGTILLILLVHLFNGPAFKPRLDKLLNNQRLARPERMRIASWFFLFLFTLSFVLLAQHSFSVVQWILHPREGYQYHRTAAGEWYALCVAFLSMALVLGTVYAPSISTLLKQMPIFFFGVYLLGSKDYILLYVAYYVIILSMRKFRYLLPLAITMASLGALLVLYNLGTSMNGVTLENIAVYSDSYVNAAHYYQRYLDGRIPLYYGKIGFTSFWRMTPRALFPDKPYVYGVTFINEIFFPGMAAKSFTPAFATVTYFADFGWLGILLHSLLDPGLIFTALLYVVALPSLSSLDPRQSRKHPRLLFYAFVLLAAPGLMVYFDFPLNILLFTYVVLIIELISRIVFLNEPISSSTRSALPE